MVCRACHREIKGKAPVLVPQPLASPVAFCGARECRPALARTATMGGWQQQKGARRGSARPVP